METIPFPRATALAHQLIADRLKPGDLVVDATVGNGHDTVFLAKRVGPEGQVFGFDVQAEAIDATQKKVSEAGFENVALFQKSHALLAEHITGKVTAAMFNLGYLPSGDKSVITRGDSTVQALQSLCELGVEIITVVAYTGHEGGRAEADAVIAWAELLEQTQYTVIQYQFVNQKNNPPFLLAIEQKK